MNLVSSLLIKVISGGAVGYCTNLLAIKMLFRKFPLIGGGVILETYEQLKDNLSDLVERDLINHKTIETELHKDEFKNAFSVFINHIIYESLEKEIPNLSIKEIPEFNTFENNINSFLLSNSNVFENTDLEILFKHINLTDLLPEQQLSKIIEILFEAFSEFVGKELKSFLYEFYSEIETSKLTDILVKEKFDIILKNLNNSIKNINHDLRDFDTQIDESIEDLYKLFEVEKLIEKLERIIKNKTFEDIIGEKNKKDISKEFIQQLIDFVNSEQGKSFLNNLSLSLIKLAQEIDRALLDFLNPVLQEKLFDFLERNLPYLVEISKEWLRINKEEIEELIENTIEEYYSNQDIWGQLKLIIKDVVGLKVSEYFEVVEKGIKKLEEYVDNKATNDLVKEIVNFLENKTIGELLFEIGINNDNLSEILRLFINEQLPKLNIQIFESFFKKKTGQISFIEKSDFKLLFKENVNVFLLRQLKENYLYTSEFSKQVQDLINKKSSKLLENNVSILLPLNQIEGKIMFLPFLLSMSKQKIINKLNEEANNSIKDKNVSDIVNFDNKIKLKDKIINLYKTKISSLGNLYKDYNIKNIYHKFISNDEFSENINKKAIDQVYANLESAVEGKISGTVRNQVRKFTPEQLRDKIEYFMGRELKPITGLGALLGALSGVILLFTQGDPSTLELQSTFNYFMTPVTYAFVGIGTNWIALKMLFKPYEKKYFLGIKIPFTPGIVGKRKGKFAESMGNFVSNNLLTGETLKNNFNENIKSEIRKAISKDNYKNVENLLINNNERISNSVSPYILDSAIKKLDDSKEDLSEKFIDYINKIELNNINYSNYEPLLSETIDKSTSFLKKMIQTKIDEYKDKKIEDLPGKIPEKLHEFIANLITNEVNKISDILNDEDKINSKIKEFLRSLDEDKYLKITLNDFMTDKSNESFINSTSDYLNETIKRKVNEGIHNFIHNNLMKEELSPDREIKELFDGELVTFLKKNMYSILDSLLFGIGLEKLKSEKEKISNNIIREVKKSNQDNIIFGIGGAILNIDKDIKEIVHLIIDEKIGPYLQNKKWELENILSGYIDFLSRKKLEDTGLSQEIINSESITTLVTKLINNEEITNNINLLSKSLIERVLNLELYSLLKLISLESFEKLSDIFAEEINIVRKDALVNVKENNDKISKTFSDFSSNIIKKSISPIMVKDLLENINDKDIEIVVNNLLELFYTSKTFTTYKSKMINEFFNKIKDKKIEDIIDIMILKESFINITNKISNNKDFRLEIENIFKPLFIKFIGDFNLLLDNQTKDFIFEIILNSIFSSFTEKAEELFESINIKYIVEREINSMHPSQVEELFNSFAKPYFNKLIFYGWLGGIIGLADILVLLAF